MNLDVTHIRRVDVELADGERPVILVSGRDFTVVSVSLDVIEDGTERVDGEITLHGSWLQSRRPDKVLSTRLHPALIPGGPLEPIVANMLAAR
jgi:hypothetical protein